MAGIKTNHLKIPNHYSSNMSELDMRIIRAVPPGGNWKDIPLEVPSKRIAQIRESFAQGKGSRSTYYGRLLPEKPSYTINTYFNRPGNGCHIHYEQNRVLSQREAARLQSFPDDFVFTGPQTSVNTQIGNAVPPLLAYQIAKEIERSIGTTGCFVDLFSGAGGMGLGFKWAGWQPVLASDIEPRYLATYAANVHGSIIAGSISDQDTFARILQRCQELKRKHHDKPFWILGGPPCQGFSTAGNKRSMQDQRNSLFTHYKAMVEQLMPDGFVFENVAGLLNMEQGRTFDRIKSEFESVMPSLTGWVLNSEDYGIPQRRKRVILVGAKDRSFRVDKPSSITSKPIEGEGIAGLKKWISTCDALSDLPALNPGMIEPELNYIAHAKTDYQKLMRGLVSPSDYLLTLK
jgi:DNA (cytosine-5)-methyltransferase 1